MWAGEQSRLLGDTFQLSFTLLPTGGLDLSGAFKTRLALFPPSALFLSQFFLLLPLLQIISLFVVFLLASKRQYKRKKNHFFNKHKFPSNFIRSKSSRNGRKKNCPFPPLYMMKPVSSALKSQPASFISAPCERKKTVSLPSSWKTGTQAVTLSCFFLLCRCFIHLFLNLLCCFINH